MWTQKNKQEQAHCSVRAQMKSDVKLNIIWPFRNNLYNLLRDKSRFRTHRNNIGLYGCLNFCFVHESAPPVRTACVVFANVFSLVSFPLWNENAVWRWSERQIVRHMIRERRQRRSVTFEMRGRSQAARDFLCNSKGKSPSAILCLHFSSCTLLLTSPPSPPPPWAVNVNGCISLSLNFTYDFPGAKHSKQAPLSLSWNAPGDATHFRRVTRTRPCRAGSDVYDLYH